MMIVKGENIKRIEGKSRWSFYLGENRPLDIEGLLVKASYPEVIAFDLWTNNSDDLVKIRGLHALIQMIM